MAFGAMFSKTWRVHKIFTNKKIQRMVSFVAALRPVVHAFIDYCNIVMCGASNVHIRPLQNVLNAAARLILCKRKYDRITAAIRDIALASGSAKNRL